MGLFNLKLIEIQEEIETIKERQRHHGKSEAWVSLKKDLIEAKKTIIAEK